MAKCYEREYTFNNIARKRQRKNELQRVQVSSTDKLNNRIFRAEYNDPDNAIFNFFLKDLFFFSFHSGIMF